MARGISPKSKTAKKITLLRGLVTAGCNSRLSPSRLALPNPGGLASIIFPLSNFFCNSGRFFLLEGSDRELFPLRTRAEEKQQLGTKAVKTSHSLIAANHSVGHGKGNNSRAPFVLPRSDLFWQDRSMRSVRGLSLLRFRDRLLGDERLPGIGRDLFHLRRTQSIENKRSNT